MRIVLIIVALAAGGWLFVQERAAKAEEGLTAIGFEGKGDPADADRLLAAARRLNPDRRPDLFEAVVRARAGRTREAIAAIRRVTAAEPQNIEAWALLASVAARSDPETAAAARARTRELAPPVR